MVRLEVPWHVLQHFWDLANIDAETRRESAVNLVNELKQAQDEHVPGGADDGTLMGGGGGGDANGVVDGPALEGCSPVLVYALKRLARGLGSGRSGARQGFALALTAAFTEIPPSCRSPTASSSSNPAWSQSRRAPRVPRRGTF